MRLCFAEVSESRHSPLVLARAPAQGPCSLLSAQGPSALYELILFFRKRNFYSGLCKSFAHNQKRADSLTLRHGESPKTAHKVDTSHPQELRAVFVPPITIEPSRWCRSPRVTSNELSLDPNKALESGWCTLELLELTRQEFTQDFESSLGNCYSLALQDDSQLIKWAKDLPCTRWRSINTTHQVQGSATQIPQKMSAPDALDVAPDTLHRASGASSIVSCTCKPTLHRTRQPGSGVPPKPHPVRSWFVDLSE